MQYFVVCNSCGKGFTYSDEDVKKNTGQAFVNVLSSVGTIAGAASGSWGGAIANKMNEKELRDFTRCPYCNSHDIKNVSEEEFQRSQKKLNGGAVVSINANASVETLITRTKLLIEEHDWDKAEAYCSQILDIEPQNAEVYFLMMLIEKEAENAAMIREKKIDIRTSKYYKSIMRFGDEALKEEVDALNAAYDNKIKEEIRLKEEREQNEREQRYLSAVSKAESSEIALLRQAVSEFTSLGTYKDSAANAESCRNKIAELESAKKNQTSKTARATFFVLLFSVLSFVAIAFSKPVAIINMAVTVYFLVRFLKQAQKKAIKVVVTIIVILLILFSVLALFVA